MDTDVALPDVGGGRTGTSSGDAAPAVRGASAQRLSGALRLAWMVGIAAFAVQFGYLALHSWHLWSHFDLTTDFAAYSQAWQRIATGHLDPYETVYAWNYPHYGYPFYQSDLELMLWPLALLYWVYPHAVDLLFVQDAALAGAGLVAYRWALEHLARHAPNRRFALAGGALVGVIALAQPWTYWTASFDYHFEPLGILFTLLAGRDLWAGRGRAWLWVALVLACGNVTTTYLIGLGVALLLSSLRRWRPALVLVVVALAWMAVVGLVHSGKAADLSAYAYLAARQSVPNGIGGIAAIVGGVIAHPTTAARVLSTRWDQIYKYVAGAGTVGVASCVGLVLAVVVLVPNALNSSPGFISDVAAFQSEAAVMAAVVGTAMVMTWIAGRAAGPAAGAAAGGGGLHRHRPRRRARRAVLGTLALLIGLGAVVQTLVMTTRWEPQIAPTFERVGAATAAELAVLSARIPASAEAVVSQGVVGRFAARRLIYPFFDTFADGQRVPVFGRTLYVVLVPTEGLESAPVAGTDAAIALMRKLGARRIADRDGVSAFEWRVPRGRHTLTFPVP